MFATLAQILTDAPVARLPDPPALARYLFESPWVPIALLVVAGVIGFVVLNRQGKARQGVLALGGGVVVAAVLAIVALVVETPREFLIRQTRALVARTAAADTAGVRPFLSDRVTVVCALPVPLPLPETKQALLDAVQQQLGNTMPIREHSVGGEQASIDGPNTARTQLRVWVTLEREQAVYGGPIGSWWKIDWRKEGDDWRVATITLLQLDGFGSGPR